MSKDLEKLVAKPIGDLGDVVDSAAHKQSHLIKQSDVQAIIRMMNNDMSLDAEEMNDKENESQKSDSNDTGYDELNMKASLENSRSNNSKINNDNNKKNENSDYYSQTEKDSSSDSFKNENFLSNDNNENKAKGLSSDAGANYDAEDTLQL